MAALGLPARAPRSRSSDLRSSRLPSPRNGLGLLSATPVLMFVPMPMPSPPNRSAVDAPGEGVRRCVPLAPPAPPSEATLLFARSCAGRLTPVVVVVVVVALAEVAALTRLALSARRRVKRLLNACILLRGLWGGLLGASALLGLLPPLLLPLLLTAVEYGPGESRDVLDEVKGVVMLVLPRLCCPGCCCCCWSKLGRPPRLGRVPWPGTAPLARSTLGRGRCAVVAPGVPAAWTSMGPGRDRSRLGRGRSVLVRFTGLSMDGRGRWRVVSIGGSQGRAPRCAGGFVTAGVAVVVVVVVAPSLEKRRGAVALEREAAVGLNKVLVRVEAGAGET